MSGGPVRPRQWVYRLSRTPRIRPNRTLIDRTTDLVNGQNADGEGAECGPDRLRRVQRRPLQPIGRQSLSDLSRTCPQRRRKPERTTDRIIAVVQNRPEKRTALTSLRALSAAMETSTPPPEDPALRAPPASNLSTIRPNVCVRSIKSRTRPGTARAADQGSSPAPTVSRASSAQKDTPMASPAETAQRARWER